MKVHTAVFNTNNQQGPVYSAGTHSTVINGSLDGRAFGENGYVYVEAGLNCIPETITEILLVNMLR